MKVAEKIWEEYQKGVKYQRDMGFVDDFPKYVDFKEGNQWAKATENTKNLPRPVFNITEMFITRKRSSIANQPVQMTFKPMVTTENDETVLQGAKDYTDFAKILWEDLEQDELNNDFVDDALTVGTGILHYFFDNEIAGQNDGVLYQGALRGEVLDPLNVFFANPMEKKVEKQKHIIIQTRPTVEEVKKLAKANKVSKELMNLIQPDNNESGEYTEEKTVENNSELITLLTKYYKKENGEVYYTKTTKNVVVVPERRLSPTERETAITMYPIVVLSGIKRKKSVYGISVAKDIITINKLYNQLKAMQALNGIQCGNPTMLVKKNALRQKVTNEGGQILVDYYQGGGDGIKYMQPPQFTNIFSQVSAEIFEMARTTTGVTDVSTGEAMGANMAASAIIALQNTAKTPVKELQTRYYNALKKVGEIWCQFFKTYYDMTRKISVENEQGEMSTRMFRGSDYRNIDFKIKIEIGVTSENESLSLSMLDAMRARGDITKEQYLDLAPESAVPFKRELKTMWEKQNKQDLLKALEIIKQQQAIIGNLEAQVQENSNINAEMQAKIQENEETIASLTSAEKQLELEEKQIKIQQDRSNLNKMQFENVMNMENYMKGGDANAVQGV